MKPSLPIVRIELTTDRSSVYRSPTELNWRLMLVNVEICVLFRESELLIFLVFENYSNAFSVKLDSA